VLDRSFLPGDVAVPVQKNDNPQSGLVIDTEMSLTMRAVSGQHKVYKNVSSRDIKKFVECGPHSVVARDNWVGFVSEVHLDIDVKFKSGLLLRVHHATPDLIRPERIDDEDMEIEEFYPGLRVLVTKELMGELNKPQKGHKIVKGVFNKKFRNGVVSKMTVVAMEVDWVYPRYLQYERPKPPCSCAYDSVTVVEDPFAYSRIAFGDYALIPRSLYSEPPPKAQNNNNNNNKNNNKKKGKGASKAKAEPPKSDSEEVSDDLLCAWVVMTETKVKLQWQDGSIQEGILSKDLISRTNALDNDFWPQDIAVMRQGAYREHTRVVVQNVDAAERTCTVKFIDGGPERKVFQNAKGDEDKKQEAEEGDGDEEISVYDLQPLEELSVEPGDLVLRLHPGPASAASSSSSKEDPLDWLGVVMRLKDGLVCVNWLDGSKGECPPDDLFHVENDSEAEGEDDYYSDEEYDSDSASEEYDSDDSEDGVPLNDPLVELLYDRYFGQDDDDEEDIDSDEFDNNLVAGLAMGMMNLASYFQGRDGTCHNIDDLEELEEIVSDDEEDEPKKTIGIREIEEIDEVEESEENNEESEKKDDKKSKTPSSSSSSSSSAAAGEEEEDDSMESFTILSEGESCSFFYNDEQAVLGPKKLRLIQKEWKLFAKHGLQNALVRAYENSPSLLRALFFGTEQTPYEGAVFLIDMNLSADYPASPPTVYYHSCGPRLHPNLYENGRVCLSLLGTWSGKGVEVWSAGSNCLQVVLSIQGLILGTPEPYYLEAGYDKHKDTLEGAKASRNYNENVFVLVMRSISFYLASPPPPFEEAILQHFREKKQDILKRCEKILAAPATPENQVDFCLPAMTLLLEYPSKGFKCSLKRTYEALIKSFDKYL